MPEAISSAAADFAGVTLDELAALDSEFFAYPHDLTDLLFAYVAAHPEEFGELPQAGSGEPSKTLLTHRSVFLQCSRLRMRSTLWKCAPTASITRERGPRMAAAAREVA